MPFNVPLVPLVYISVATSSGVIVSKISCWPDKWETTIHSIAHSCVKATVYGGADWLPGSIEHVLFMHCQMCTGIIVYCMI